MEDYLDYELTELIDMLAERTATYTQLMSDGFHNGEEFAQIGEEILEIQKAIWVKMGFASKSNTPER
jgi:hypothetical protein